MSAATGAEVKQDNWISSGPVLLHYADHIATLTLNRPDVSNGMNLDLMHALHKAVMVCHGQPQVRVVHLRGAGPHFCAGVLLSRQVVSVCLKICCST